MLYEPRLETRFLSPLLALQSIQAEFQRLLGEPSSERSPALAFALFTRDDGVLLRTALPGIDPANLTLEIDGSALTLAGRFEDEPENDKAGARHIERPRGSFTRTLHLPIEVDAKRVEAKLERGVLEVVLPCVVKDPPVKIQVLPEGKRNSS
jgi:HSP20 family protein